MGNQEQQDKQTYTGHEVNSYQDTHRKIVDESTRVSAQLSIEDALAAPLQQQQLIEGLEDVDGRLVDGAYDGAAGVDNVAHSPHHNGSRPCIQPCEPQKILGVMQLYN